MRNPLLLGAVLALGFLSTNKVIALGCASLAPMAGAQTVQGRIVVHRGLRDWVELVLERPLCGQSSIEMFRDRDHDALETYAGCRVRTKGPMGDAPTGYYMKPYNQNVKHLSIVGTCRRTTLPPDLSKGKPDPKVHDYLVELDVNASPGDHPAIVRATSRGRVLRPWQVYANTFLTGGNVLYARCGKGFAVDVVSGPPGVSLGHMDAPRLPNDQAAFDADPTGHPGNTYSHVMYTCTRDID